MCSVTTVLNTAVVQIGFPLWSTVLNALDQGYLIGGSGATSDQRVTFAWPAN